jgi:hypothetical protein
MELEIDRDRGQGWTILGETKDIEAKLDLMEYGGGET